MKPSRIVLVLLAALAAAPAAKTTNSTPTATLPARLTGTYVAYFTGKERSSSLPSGHNLAPGPWVLDLHPTVAAFYDPTHPDPQFVVHTPVSTSGNRLVFAPYAKCPDQRPPATTGTYSYVRAGRTLRFTKVRDSCNDRATTLTAHPWTTT